MIPHVVAALGVGHDNAVKRHELARRLGVPDRKMRKMIELARNDGWMILNDGDGAGYYLAANLDQVEHKYKVERARALKTLKTIRPMRIILKANGRKV